MIERREDFFRALNDRLDAGERAYGNKSFERPSAELLEELKQEALDLAGWGYILWCRLGRLQEAAEKVEGRRRESRS